MGQAVAIYRDYDLDALERQYDIEATVADLAQLLTGYDKWSEEVMADLAPSRDLAYGPDPLQRLDVFPVASPNAPIMIYIHGGYWKRGDKAGRAFAARPFHDHGIIWVSVNYRLAPAVGLDDIVADTRAAIAWVHANAERFGGDRDRLYLSGSSAGGHLAGMAMAPGWHGDYGLPEDVVKGATAMSGLYDLRPFLHTSQRDYLRLDKQSAARNSPLEHLPTMTGPILIAWGGKETDEFERQSKAYAAACTDKRLNVETMRLVEQNHFSLMSEMGAADSLLTQAMLRMVSG